MFDFLFKFSSGNPDIMSSYSTYMFIFTSLSQSLKYSLCTSDRNQHA